MNFIDKYLKNIDKKKSIFFGNHCITTSLIVQYGFETPDTKYIYSIENFKESHKNYEVDFYGKLKSGRRYMDLFKPDILYRPDMHYFQNDDIYILIRKGNITDDKIIKSIYEYGLPKNMNMIYSSENKNEQIKYIIKYNSYE